MTLYVTDPLMCDRYLLHCTSGSSEACHLNFFSICQNNALLYLYKALLKLNYD